MTGTHRGRWWKITLAVVGSGLLLAVFGIWLFFLAATHRAYPDVESEVTVAGLNAPVEVIRDDMGIAHIYAADPHDLFLAQGYVHAQERFWQMDFWRHLGAGRLSELSGSSQVENDTFLRALGGRTWPRSNTPLRRPRSRPRSMPMPRVSTRTWRSNRRRI